MTKDVRPGQQASDKEQPLIAHLTELRTRLVHSLICVVLVFIVLSPFYAELYSTLAAPLLEIMPAGTNMIATEVASPFIVPFKLTAFLAVFISIPYLLYHTWAFVAPGLYLNEKRFALPLFFSSIVLFYTGAAFAYFVVFPLVFTFFTSVAPEGVMVMTDISHYLSFVLKMFFAFGIAFEVPIATILLVATGIVDRETLRKKRPYIIVGAFVVGMFLTPPDVLSQFLLAVPVIILFEAGLYLSKYFIKDAGSPDENKSGDKGPNAYKDLYEDD